MPTHHINIQNNNKKTQTKQEEDFPNNIFKQRVKDKQTIDSSHS